MYYAFLKIELKPVSYVPSYNFLGVFDSTDAIDAFIQNNGPSEFFIENYNETSSWKTISDSPTTVQLIRTVKEPNLESHIIACEIEMNKGTFVSLSHEATSFFSRITRILSELGT